MSTRNYLLQFLKLPFSRERIINNVFQNLPSRSVEFTKVEEVKDIKIKRRIMFQTSEATNSPCSILKQTENMSLLYTRI